VEREEEKKEAKTEKTKSNGSDCGIKPTGIFNTVRTVVLLACLRQQWFSTGNFCLIHDEHEEAASTTCQAFVPLDYVFRKFAVVSMIQTSCGSLSTKFIHRWKSDIRIII
jgi:hypothetical protein